MEPTFMMVIELNEFNPFKVFTLMSGTEEVINAC